MSSSRKRPCCHSCGTPMAGHKRPNGAPICPREGSPYPHSSTPPSTPPSSRRNSLSVHTTSVQDLTHRRNPNWILPANPPRHDVHIVEDPKFPLVPTELDDPIAEKTRSVEDWRARLPPPAPPSEPSSSASSSSSSSSSSASSVTSSRTSSSSSSVMRRVARNVSKQLANSAPLASIFSTPREDIKKVTQAARHSGLYTGVLHSPAPPRIKVEPNDGQNAVAVARESSWWVVMGVDPGAVDRLVDLHHQEEMAQTLRPDPQRNETVGAFPVDPRHLRITYLDIIFAGAIGGFMVFYFLSVW